MLDRQRLEALLSNRFPGATAAQVAAAANAIMAMMGGAGNPAVADKPQPKQVQVATASGWIAQR